MLETEVILKFISAAAGIYAVGFSAGKLAAWIRGISSAA